MPHHHHSSHLHEPAASRESRTGSAHRPALVFDRQGVRAVDRAAIEEYGIPGVVLMENAARGLTEHALDMLRRANDPHGGVLIICGSGNNGGDGYALARHLHNRGVHIILAPLGEPDPKSDAGINRAICRAMKLTETGIDQLDDRSANESIALIVDAVFGTGLDRPVPGQAAATIEWINQSRRPVLAADLPSGMDCDTGRALGIAVRATRTVTFVGWKAGFLELEAQKLLGEVHVADIGAPIELLHRFGRPLESPHRESPEHDAAETRPQRPGR